MNVMLFFGESYSRFLGSVQSVLESVITLTPTYQFPKNCRYRPCVCVCCCSASTYVGFRMYNGVIPGRVQGIHLHFGKGSRFMDQAVKFSVLKVLCRGLSLGSLLSTGRLPTVVCCRDIPGDVFQYLCAVLRHHWYNFGILQLPESFHYMFEVLVFGHFLDFCIVSRKSPVSTP